MKRPLAGLAILFGAGVWTGSVTEWAVEWGWGCAAGLLAAFFLLRQRLPFVFALVFVAGAVAHRDATSSRDPRDVANLLPRQSHRAEVRGVVRSDPTGRSSFFLEVEAVRLIASAEDLPAWTPATGRLFVRLRAVRPVAYGDVVEFSASVRAPRPPRNPGEFDQVTWLARQRVQRVATVWPRDRWVVVASERGNPVVAQALRLRTRLEAALHAGLEGEPGLAGVLAGMVIGERAEIPPDVYTAFQRTGMVHVFAVSGWNVALVTLVVVTALRVAQVPQRVCGIVTMPLLAMYVLATGAQPSAVRALVMACVWLGGWVLVRPPDLLNSVAAGALAILVWDPLQLFDGGFVLSFVVVLSLVLLTPPIERPLQRLIARDPLVPEELLPPWYRPWQRRGRTLVQWLSGSVAAWMGLLPVLPHYFHLFTPISILGNVLAVPILGIITALGMVVLLAHPVWPWLAATFNNANYALLTILINGVEWLATVPFGYRFVGAPAFWLSALYGAVLLAAARWPVAWYGVPALGVALFIPWPVERAVEVTVVDLNRGGAIFVNVPGEADDFLVDGGDAVTGTRVVVPVLRAAGVDRLGAVVLSRADKNHAAGLQVVAAELPVGRAFHAGLWSRSAAYAEWLADCRARGIELEKWRAGMEEGLVHVFHPATGAAADRSEDQVLVIGVEFGPTRVLLAGDASAEVLTEIQDAVRDYRPQIVVQGMDGASWPEFRDFLMEVRPEWAVICRPPPSRFHPRRELPEPPVPILRTDDTGAVTLRLTKKGYAIKTMLPGG